MSFCPPTLRDETEKETAAATKIQQRCPECRQLVDDPDFKIFSGDSNDAVS